MKNYKEEKLEKIREQIDKLESELKGLEWERNQFLKRLSITEDERLDLQIIEELVDELHVKLAPLYDEADLLLHAILFSPFRVGGAECEEEAWVYPSGEEN